MFDEIARLIYHVDAFVIAKGYPTSVQQDKASFERWNNGEINTKECIKRFLENNKQPEDTYVDVELFRKWMKSLGYIRGKK